ncbi:MAG: hypothetical protein JXQ84_09525 [Rhodospirillaceae bacterium]|nr:hypothetical protein [Rhodospirillaceae bacterium]
MIDCGTLTQVIEILATSAARDVTVVAKQVRSKIPEITISTCDDDDVCGVKPLAETPGINLYLLSTNGVCLSLTRDPEIAMGVVLASVATD